MVLSFRAASAGQGYGLLFLLQRVAESQIKLLFATVRNKELLVLHVFDKWVI